MPSRTGSSTRSARFLAAVGVVVMLGAAVGLVLREPWHGPVILSLSTGHGIHAGNLAVVPLVALAIVMARRALLLAPSGGHPIRRALSGRWVAAISAIVFGLLLLAAAVIDLLDRGPLVPTGGGTFDGTVQFVSGRTDDPVGVWSYLALTYDGSTLRLFLNGDQVASQPTTGAVKSTGNPLWLGGNHPLRGVLRRADRRGARVRPCPDRGRDQGGHGDPRGGGRRSRRAAEPRGRNSGGALANRRPGGGVLVRRGDGKLGGRPVGQRQRRHGHWSDLGQAQRGQLCGAARGRRTGLGSPQGRSLMRERKQ
jgi:hypothetical protein